MVVKLPSLTRRRRAGRPSAPPDPQDRAPRASPIVRVKEMASRSFASSPRVASIDAFSVAPDWLKDTRTIPAELVSDSFQIRALSRRLSTNIPLYSSFVDATMTNTLEPRFPDLEWDEAAPSALVDQLRQLWTEFRESPSSDGGLTGVEFCKNLLRHTMIDGDIFWTTTTADGRLYFRPIEADLVDGSQVNTSTFESLYTYFDRKQNRKRDPIVGGIGFSSLTGQPVRYYFSRPIKDSLPAEDVVHVRRGTGVGWPRGVPWGRPSFNTLVRLESFAGAEMERQINSAKLYFYTTSEGGHTPVKSSFEGPGGSATNILTVLQPGTDGSVGSETNPKLNLKRNTITQLDPGTKLETLNELGNKISPVPYIQILLTQAASGLGLSLPLLLRDYNNTNFSSGRLAGESDKLYFQAVRDWTRTDIFYPILRKLYEHGVANRRIVAPDGVLPAELRMLLQPSVRWPSWPTTEPHREIPALIMAGREGAMSLQGIISRIDTHATVEEVLAQIAKEQVLKEQYGLADLLGASAEKAAADAEMELAKSAAEDAANRQPSPANQGQSAQNPPTT